MIAFRKVLRYSSVVATFTFIDSFVYPLNFHKIVSFCSTSSPISTILKSTEDNVIKSGGISELRKEYSKQGLDESDIPQDPFDQFQVWFSEACNSNILEPNAMCLSTCENSKPSARYVLLKGYDKNGFIWYTNYESRKGKELENNKYASLTFWWGELERSVRIEGIVEKVSDAQSDEYFSSRPRNSQIGAWTSNQSKSISSREELVNQEKIISEKFEKQEKILRPPHWGGYRLKPTRIEFWKGRESRLHDRIVYERSESFENIWSIKRLQP